MEIRQESERLQALRYARRRARRAPLRRSGRDYNAFKETLLLQLIVSGIFFACVLAAHFVDTPLSRAFNSDLRGLITYKFDLGGAADSAAGIFSKIKSGDSLGTLFKSDGNSAGNSAPDNVKTAGSDTSIQDTPAPPAQISPSSSDAAVQPDQGMTGAATDDPSASAGADVNFRIDEDIMSKINDTQDEYNLKNARPPEANAKTQPEG